MNFLRPRRLRTLTVEAHPRKQPHLSAASGYPRLITMDMGGTSQS